VTVLTFKNTFVAFECCNQRPFSNFVCSGHGFQKFRGRARGEWWRDDDLGSHSRLSWDQNLAFLALSWCAGKYTTSLVTSNSWKEL